MTTNIFATRDMPFAAFLICTKRLTFIKIEKGKDGIVHFLFADPEGAGNEYFGDYQSGAVAPALPFMPVCDSSAR